jgi:hypothetical protein
MTDTGPGGDRRLAAALEPLAGQVYFSPECHAGYERLGFDPSPRVSGSVALPDGPAYFTSRGSLLGQVPGTVVAAVFGVFNPAVVVPAVALGWSRTDATTICEARTAGAIAQLTRILGPAPEGIDRVQELLERAGERLRPEGRPLYAGLLALELPEVQLGVVWRHADRLREFRGDAHIAAWTVAGLDAVQIGLLTELFWGLPMRTYIRTRAWGDEQLDQAERQLIADGHIADGRLTDSGRQLRERIEQWTDQQCAPILDALADDLSELIALLAPWGTAIRGAGGYPAGGPHQLAAQRS